MLRPMVEQGADRDIDYRVHEDDPASLVAARLRRSGYPFLRVIKCEHRDGVIVLSGTVPTFHLKQVAREMAAHTAGVHHVDNRVHVTSSPYRPRHSAAG